jgi:hypothetical protein
MYVDHESYETLAAKAGGGDAAAAERLREKLGPQMMRIVSHALRTGDASNPLARRVLAKARQVAAVTARRPGEHRESVAGAAARQLCESVIDRLLHGPAGPQNLCETVLA